MTRQQLAFKKYGEDGMNASISSTVPRRRASPLILSACCLLLCLASQPQVVSARLFRPGSTNTGSSNVGFGSVSINARNKQQQQQQQEGTNAEEPELLRPGKNDNDNNQFFETVAYAAVAKNKQANAGDDDDDGDFFGIDDTELPTGITPTQSALPTWEPTVAPTFSPETEEQQQEAPPLPDKTVVPTVSPTLLSPKEITTPPTTLRPTTLRPTSPPTTQLTARPTSVPSEAGTISEAPLETTATKAPNATETEVELDLQVEFPAATTPPTDNNPASNSTENATTSTTDVVEATQEPTTSAPKETVTTATTTLAPSTLAPTTEATADLPLTTNEEAPPTESPTTPSTQTTMPPTLRETEPRVGQFPVSAQISLRLNGIAKALAGDTRLLFLATVDQFISSASTGMVEDIRVMLIYQSILDLDDIVEDPSNDPGQRRRRRLEKEVLQVDLAVEGLAHEEVFSASEWHEWLEFLFQKEGREFVGTLQEMGDAEGNVFFVPLENAQVVDRVVPVVQVTPTPAPTKGSKKVPPLNANSSSQEEGAPLVAIVGAAVGGFVFLIIGILLVRYVMQVESRRKRSASSHSPANSLDENFGPTPEQNEGQRGGRSSSNNHRSIQPKPSHGESSISSESYLTSSVNHHMNFHAGTGTSMGSSNNFNPYNSAPPSEVDNMSQFAGTINGDMSQADNASYAYSLEPGIEPSVAGTVPQSVAASAMSFSAYPGGSSVASMTSGTSSFAFVKLPRGGSGGSGGRSLAGKPTKDVLAPPGKLGIVIDTTLNGPVVHKVNPGSALEGKIKSGDIIVAIDDVDTRAMTAASITALMVKTANQRRKLTIVSPY